MNIFYPEGKMKKIISALLCLAILFTFVTGAAASSSKSFGAYKRVFIIGIDGAGRFIKDADTPNFDRIFADGAVKYDARTETKTDSGPNWGGILTGASYFKTRLSNSTVSDKERSADTEYPSIFNVARKAMPDAELASFVNWNPINYGIIEKDIGVTKHNKGDDAQLTDDICAYFDEGNDPALFFVQFDSVDHVGHDEGSKAPGYIAQINIVDGYLGRVYDCLDRNGLLEDALFIVVADHGHMVIGGHGGITMRESLVTIAAKGKTVIKGGEMDSDTRNRDVSAVALYALGLERPDSMTSRIPANLFEDTDGESRPLSKDPLDTFVGALAWFITKLTAFI